MKYLAIFCLSLICTSNLSAQLVVDNKAGLKQQLTSDPTHALEGHEGTVFSIAVSPDGKHILSGSGDKTLKLWTLEGQLVRTFEGHKSRVYSVAFSPGGQHILSGGADNTLKLWSLGGGLVRTIKEHRKEIHSVAFSPDGKHILSGSFDSTLKLWSLGGRLVRTFFGHDGYVTSVAFSPDGQHILSGNWPIGVPFGPYSLPTLRLWSLDGRLVRTIKGHRKEIHSVAFSPDGKHILSGSADRTLKLWSLGGGLIGTSGGD